MPRITNDGRVIASVASLIPTLGGRSLFWGTRLLVSELFACNLVGRRLSLVVCRQKKVKLSLCLTK
jgi:hypothetical protein